MKPTYAGPHTFVRPKIILPRCLLEICNLKKPSPRNPKIPRQRLHSLLSTRNLEHVNLRPCEEEKLRSRGWDIGFLARRLLAAVQGIDNRRWKGVPYGIQRRGPYYGLLGKGVETENKSAGDTRKRRVNSALPKKTRYLRQLHYGCDSSRAGRLKPTTLCEKCLKTLSLCSQRHRLAWTPEP